MLNFLSKLFASKKSTSDSKIITAKVMAIDKHPNADRLRVLRLDTGSGEVYPVVCGATNFVQGDIVALALPGARISHNIHSQGHEPFTLQKATIRDIESQGMICAGFELSLSEHPETREQGIVVFPPGTPLGQDIHSISK